MMRAWLVGKRVKSNTNCLKKHCLQEMAYFSLSTMKILKEIKIIVLANISTDSSTIELSRYTLAEQKARLMEQQKFRTDLIQ